MKALTIQQPYASLIADGEKWVENRGWYTTYRGPLAIHAGSGTRYLNAEVLASYPTGVVIATGNLVACIRLGRRRLVQRDSAGVLVRLGITVEDFLAHEHTEGPFCLILQDVRKLAVPIPATDKRKLGLWEWVEK